MDPDAALATARSALVAIRLIESAPSPWVSGAEAHDNLADAFEALDEWITKGGFLPAAWSR